MPRIEDYIVAYNGVELYSTTSTSTLNFDYLHKAPKEENTEKYKEIRISKKNRTSINTRKQRVDKVLKSLYEEVFKLIPPFLLEEFKNNTYISGGCISDIFSGRTPKDYDFFFTNEESAKKVSSYFLACMKEKYVDKSLNGEMFIYYGKRPISCITQNAITLIDNKKRIIQLIYNFYNEPEKMIKTFDFYHTMAYYEYDKKTKYICPMSYYFETRIYYNNNTHVSSIATLKRVIKSLRRNKTISEKSLQEIYEKIDKELNVNNIENIKNEISSFGYNNE